ncbi:MAG: PIG-L family deacetylase [Leptospiraceae bacterium]|nr:PIG-L family deacetylase [Leptospiraceae bacterium]
MNMKIICIGAHPDDVELAMGGTVLKLVDSGHEILLLDITNGEPTPFGSEEIRNIESKKASKLLGVERITLNLPNRYLMDTIEARKEIAGVLREFRPEIIFTHFDYDAHPDHISASSLTVASRFYSKLTKSDIKGEPFFPKKIIYYFPNHIHLNLLPSFCVDISAYIEKKEEVLKTYESQFLKPGKVQFLEENFEINRYYGIRIGKLFAEPFYLKETLDADLLISLFK